MPHNTATPAWVASLVLLGVALPAPLAAQLVLTSNNNTPGICRSAGKLQSDSVRIEIANPFVGRYAAYNNSAYELQLWVCPSDAPGGCNTFNPPNWRPRPTVCAGGTPAGDGWWG